MRVRETAVLRNNEPTVCKSDMVLHGGAAARRELSRVAEEKRSRRDEATRRKAGPSKARFSYGSAALKGAAEYRRVQRRKLGGWRRRGRIRPD